MASVWVARLVRKHGFEKLVAIKTILPKYAEDETFQKMFLDEARIASRIDHANVAHIHDLGEEDNILYLVMEWIDGDALTRLRRAIIKRGHPFPADIALRIMADVCAGLHAAHELRGNDGSPLGVVHRDVSPQNILINIEGVSKVIDFGVAKAAHRLVEETNTGFVKGKVQYMAPEQALGQPVDRRADCWAVGAVLYHLLANRPPFEADNQLAMLRVLTAGDPATPLPPNIPSAVAEIVMRALSHDPTKRFQSAAEMRTAIERTGLAATTDDVAECLRTYLGEQAEARRHALAVALHTAGARAEIQQQRQQQGLPQSGGHPASAVYSASTGSDSGTRPPLNPIMHSPVAAAAAAVAADGHTKQSASDRRVEPSDHFALTGPEIPAARPDNFAGGRPPPPPSPQSSPQSGSPTQSGPPTPANTPRIAGRPPPVPPPRPGMAPRAALASAPATVTAPGPFAAPPLPAGARGSDPNLGSRPSVPAASSSSSPPQQPTSQPPDAAATQPLPSSALPIDPGPVHPNMVSGGFGDFTGVPSAPPSVDAAFGGLSPTEAIYEQKTELMVAPPLNPPPTEPVTGGGQGSLGLASISSSVATNLPGVKRRRNPVVLVAAAVVGVVAVLAISGLAIDHYRSSAKFEPKFSPLPPPMATSGTGVEPPPPPITAATDTSIPTTPVTAPPTPPATTVAPAPSPTPSPVMAPAPTPTPRPTQPHGTAATPITKPTPAAPSSAKKPKPNVPPPPNDGF